MVTASGRSLPLLMCWSTGVTVSNDIVDLAAEQVGHERPAALVGDVDDLGAGQVLELGADQVLRRPVAVGAVGQLAGLRLGQRHQFCHVLGRR